MKLFLLPAATLLMANGAYASIRGATTDIVNFVDNGSIQYQCNFADDQERTCPEEEWTVQDDGSAEARGPFDCGTDGDTQLGCCTITAPKDVVDAWETARTKRNDQRANDIADEVMTFDLPGHGTCNLRDDIDFDELSTEEVKGMFESELSNGIELDEDELYPEFLQLEGKCGCFDDWDCNGSKVCVRGNCNTKNADGNRGQCKNPNNRNGGNNKSNRKNKSSNNSKCKNKSRSSCQDSNKCKWKNDKCKDKSVDNVLEELIAEEDEKAELSNGIEFVEEESSRCDRSRDCRSGEFCNRGGRCQRNNNFCRKQSDCRNRNDYCDTRRNECRRATGQGCSNGVDCGDGRGSVWACRDGRCEPRSLFELAMELVMHGEGVMFDLDEAMEEE